MKAIIELIRALTDITPVSQRVKIDKSDPIWQLAVTEYSKDAVYAYTQIKQGKNPNA